MMRFPQAHPSAAAVLVDELNFGFFECMPYDIQSRMALLTRPGFQLVHCHEANARPYTALLVALEWKASITIQNIILVKQK